MSENSYNEKLAQLEAYPNDKLTNLPMPVDTFVQEASNLHYWCQKDKVALINAGLNWDLVDDLPSRLGALQHAESIWRSEYKDYTDSIREWKKISPKAFDLRDVILHYFFHAYRDMPDVNQKVQVIAEGSSNDDMIQDLSDLSVLGKKYPTQLEVIGFDMALLDQAAENAATLNELLAMVNGNYEKATPAKVLRDKAFFFTKEAVDEIRLQGQFVYWRNDERRVGYRSKYNRKRRVTHAPRQDVEKESAN